MTEVPKTEEVKVEADEVKKAEPVEQIPQTTEEVKVEEAKVDEVKKTESTVQIPQKTTEEDGSESVTGRGNAETPRIDQAGEQSMKVEESP